MIAPWKGNEISESPCDGEQCNGTHVISGLESSEASVACPVDPLYV